MTPEEVEAATKEVQGFTCDLRNSMTGTSTSEVEELFRGLVGLKDESFFDQLALTIGKEWRAEDIAAEASGGNVSADAILCAVSIRLLDWGEVLPTPISSYVSSVLRDRLSTLKATPKMGRRHSFEGALRNMFVFSCVANLLSKFDDLQPTRNASPRRGTASACSIVRDGLDRAGVGFSLSEKRVNEIWTNESARLHWHRCTD